MRRLALIIGIVFLLCVGSNVTRADNSPEIVVERLDCSGLAFKLEGGDPKADYWVGVRGDCEYNYPQSKLCGFLHGPFRLGAGERYEAGWDERWTLCWMSWGNCWKYGIWEAQPTKIAWKVGVMLNNERLDTSYVDLAIPCGHRVYLPLIFK